MSLYQALDNAREHIFRSPAASERAFSDKLRTDSSEIRRHLGSPSNLEKTQGLKALITNIGEGLDCHSYFADVVKNVHSSDIEVREMTAAFLIVYSQHEPELTLMIVNSVQKMLSDPSAVVRMQALRLASALRVPTVVPLATHLITEVLNDVSPLVRIACCQAIGQCYELDPSMSDDLLELLVQLLSLPKQLSGNFEVAGWGLATLSYHWPQRIDKLHHLFRVYVPKLSFFNEWCQIIVCRMLVRYCRHYLTGPEDSDCKLVVEAIIPLLASLNNAVVVEAASSVFYIGTPENFDTLNIPARLLALEPSPLLWSNIYIFCQQRPESFQKHRQSMILALSPSDDKSVRKFVLKCALQCQSIELSRKEFKHLRFCALAWQDDQASVRGVLETIAGLVGPQTASSAMRWLIQRATDKQSSSQLISEALMSLRILVQQNKIGNIPAVLATLSKLVTSEQVHSSAKATIVWLMGSYCLEYPALASELLRKLLPQLASQTTDVRLQLIQLAAKLYTSYRNDSKNLDKRIPQLFDYALQLAKYDPDIDIRDRARLFSSLLRDSENSMATLLLQAATPVPLTHESGSAKYNLLINSTGAFVGKCIDAYSELESWAPENTTDGLRSVTPSLERSNGSERQKTPEASQSSKISAGSVQPKLKQLSLEEFLNPQNSDSSLGSSSDDISDAEDNGEDSDEATGTAASLLKD